METTLDRFGRVLIPKTLRDNLGIQPGEALEISAEKGQLLLHPIHKSSRLRRKKGILVFTGRVLASSKAGSFSMR